MDGYHDIEQLLLSMALSGEINFKNASLFTCHHLHCLCQILFTKHNYEPLTMAVGYCKSKTQPYMTFTNTAYYDFISILYLCYTLP